MRAEGVQVDRGIGQYGVRAWPTFAVIDTEGNYVDTAAITRIDDGGAHFLRRGARETLRAAMEAFNSGRCVVIFPAGRMADWNWRRRRLVEPGWAGTGVSLARRFGAPIVPVGVVQRMPMAYYALAQIHEELRDITLFHGLLKQRGARYRLRFGEAVDARDLPGSDGEAAETLRQTCEALAWTRRR